MLKPNILIKIVKKKKKKGYKLCSIQSCNSPILKDMLLFNEVSEIL